MALVHPGDGRSTDAIDVRNCPPAACIGAPGPRLPRALTLPASVRARAAVRLRQLSSTIARLTLREPIPCTW